MNTLQDRIRGSLIGGAIGDALGYPVEFIFSIEAIRAKYGERGITRLDTKWDECHDGKAVVSDDTQMTLFTANGLLNAKQQGIPLIDGIRNAYVEWYYTQTGQKPTKQNDCWIANIPELNACRAPGNTCMSALAAISRGGKPQNNSKGCGGVMRVAPIGLYAAVDKRLTNLELEQLGADSAELTHLHPLGYIPAAMLAHIVYRLAYDDDPVGNRLLNMYVREAIDDIKWHYKAFQEDVKTMVDLTELALQLTYNDKPDLENIMRLGQGWTGEEALAIAIYCALKYFGNFEEAMIASVNHGGDSDSTGAVCGNIIGAAVGYDTIPQFYKDDLEMHDLILQMADDLYCGSISAD